MKTVDNNQIVEERQIERALVQFARAMDARDWQALSEILAPDAAGEFGTGRLEGSSAIIEMIRGFLDNCGVTQHLLGNVLIDVDGGHATSRAYVQDLHLSRSNPELTFHTLGDYHDRWERRDGRWWLVERVKDNRGTVGSLDVFAG
ncbi:nuclear transport factor 2 family protein [Mycolicibacterium setense]|uniref:nuclear transport factor 2 family protein n=1 Tax=Mycolicibacterium setense TaxID=431269 RepID=UPI000575A66A|nr:nuclear transport factor 2 family protein [Mycolicibacterium setense]KHO24939.1 ethyl tert-butyl ether degradation protein EthD [Mycolicibacterium setense]MCV7109799.1 nuclear transport factor 2 family protein [Mycolicibacterium setense]